MSFIFLGILAWLLLMLGLREVVCWYFKINERNDLLRQNNHYLRQLMQQQVRTSQDPGGVCYSPEAKERADKIYRRYRGATGPELVPGDVTGQQDHSGTPSPRP